MSGQDNFQFRLAQWILDQLKTVKELEAVTQQFSLLVTQTQEQSIGDLYAHIAGLILERTNRVQSEGSKDGIHLYAELCYYLLAIHFEQRSYISARVVLVHEHLFCLCIDSFPAGNNVELAKTDGSSKPTIGFGTVRSSSDNEIAIEKNSELLFHLFKFQLISLAQISQYIFRVISSHKSSIDTRLSNVIAGVRLLVGLFPRSHGPWKKELDSFNKWIDTHSASEDNKTNITWDDANQGNEPNVTPTRDQFAEDKSDVSGAPLHSLNDPINSTKTFQSLQIQAYGEEELDDTVENNVGKPPRTPSTSRAESPVEGSSEERRLSTEVVTPAERQMASYGAVNHTKNFPERKKRAAEAKRRAEEKLKAKGETRRRQEPQAAECKAMDEPKRQAEQENVVTEEAEKQKTKEEEKRIKEQALPQWVPTQPQVATPSVPPPRGPESGFNSANNPVQSPPGTTPSPSKRGKVTVHTLFLGGGMPLVTTTTPVATSTPSTTAPPPQVVTPSAPPPRGPASGFNDRNNLVQFPRSPQISRPTLPGPSTSGGQRPAGSPRMSANVPLQHQHQHPMVHPHQHHSPHPGHPMQAPPQWGPAGYYYPPPHDYNPYMYWGGHPQYQHPHMPQIHQPTMQSSPRPPAAQPRPPSTPPVPNNVSPHPPPINTSLQAPASVSSPSLSVTAQPSGNLRRAVNPIRISTPSGDAITTPILPKRQSVIVRMETEQQKNERVAKEREEKERSKRPEKRE